MLQARPNVIYQKWRTMETVINWTKHKTRTSKQRYGLRETLDQQSWASHSSTGCSSICSVLQALSFRPAMLVLNIEVVQQSQLSAPTVFWQDWTNWPWHTSDHRINVKDNLVRRGIVCRLPSLVIMGADQEKKKSTRLLLYVQQDSAFILLSLSRVAAWERRLAGAQRASAECGSTYCGVCVVLLWWPKRKPSKPTWCLTRCFSGGGPMSRPLWRSVSTEGHNEIFKPHKKHLNDKLPSVPHALTRSPPPN